MSKKNQIPNTEIEHINIRMNPIKINLDTNIPEGYDSNGQYKTKQLSVTSGLLGIANAGGSEPLFSADVLYQDGAAFFAGMKPEEKPAVFFNPTKFREFINKCYSNRRKKVSVNDYKQDVENALETPADFAHKNILFMCKMLFHASFPKNQGFAESYSGSIISGANLGAELSNVLRAGTTNYTYIVDGGKTYTITFVKWQNDFYSYPAYKKIINTFNRFIGWYNSRTFFINEKVGSGKDMKKIITGGDFKEYFDNYLKGINGVPYYNANILEYIVKCIGEKFMNVDDTMNYITQVYRKNEHTYRYSGYKGLEEEINKVLQNDPDSLKRKKKTDKLLYTYLKNDLAYAKGDEKKVLETNQKELKTLIGKIHDFFKQNKDWVDFIELNNKLKESKLKGNKRVTCILKNLKSINTTMKLLKEICQKDIELKLKDDQEEWGESKVIDIIKNRQFYLGVQRANDGKFEISLFLDVVGGKVTNENVGKLGCIYTGEKLGSDFKILVDNDIFAESMRMYIDLENAAKEALVEEGAATQPPKESEKKEEKPAKKGGRGGGRKRTRKMRRFPKKTKKRTKRTGK